MTPTPENPEELRVDVPDPLTGLDDRARKLQSYVQKGKEIEDILDDIDVEAKKLNSEDLKIVADEMHIVRQKMTEAEDLDDLKRVGRRLQEVVKNPHRKAVRKAQEAVRSALELDGFNEDLTDQLSNKAETKSAEELRENRQTLEDLSSIIDGWPEAPTAVVADVVEQDPIARLSYPDDKLEPLVDSITEQMEMLKTIGMTLEDHDWAPTLGYEETEHLYVVDGAAGDASRVKTYIENLNSIVIKSWGPVKFEQVLEAQLRVSLDTATAQDIVETFNRVHMTATACADHRPAVNRAKTLESCVEDAAAYTTDAVEEALTDARQFSVREGFDTQDPLDELADNLESLDAAYDEWTGTFKKMFDRDVEAITAVQSYLDDPPSFDPPEDAIGIMKNPYSKTAIAENPEGAVKAHAGYLNWVEALRQEQADNANEASMKPVDCLLRLVRGQILPASDIDGEVFEELTTRLGGGLTLQFDDSDKGITE